MDKCCQRFSRPLQELRVCWPKSTSNDVSSQCRLPNLQAQLTMR
jgi:hypothetical protein